MDFVPRWPGVWNIRMLWQQACYEHIIHNLNSYHIVDKSPYESLLESGCICMIFRFLFILLSLSLLALFPSLPPSPLFSLSSFSTLSLPYPFLFSHSFPLTPSFPSLSLPFPPLCVLVAIWIRVICYDEVTRSKASLGRSIYPMFPHHSPSL